MTMEKFLFLLSDGEEAVQARMMTMEEAVQEEASRHDNELADPTLTWYGPFDVKNPATLQMVNTGKSIVTDRCEPSIH